MTDLIPIVVPILIFSLLMAAIILFLITMVFRPRVRNAILLRGDPNKLVATCIVCGYHVMEPEWFRTPSGLPDCKTCHVSNWEYAK